MTDDGYRKGLIVESSTSVYLPKKRDEGWEGRRATRFSGLLPLFWIRHAGWHWRYSVIRIMIEVESAGEEKGKGTGTQWEVIREEVGRKRRRRKRSWFELVCGFELNKSMTFVPFFKWYRILGFPQKRKVFSSWFALTYCRFDGYYGCLGTIPFRNIVKGIGFATYHLLQISDHRIIPL